MNRIHLLALLVVVLVVASTSFVLLYLVTRTPGLSVTDGFTLGMIKGNLTKISGTNPLAQNFTTTAYANQSGGPGSVVVLRVQTLTFYVIAPGSASFLEVSAAVQISGSMASNLHPSDVVLTVNQTTTSASTINFQSSYQTGTNVTYDRNQGFGVIGNGSGQATATPTCVGEGVGYCNLTYGVEIEVWEYLGSITPYLGFQGTITASGVSIRVGILVAIVNT